MKISYSAPAKVIFSGEHSVVYGKPALVSALDLRLTFSLCNGKSKFSPQPFIKNGSAIVLNYLRGKGIPYKKKDYIYWIHSNIPVRRGLGSSAALSVTMAAAFLKFYSGKSFDLPIINEVAYQIEKIIHRQPSGVDNSTVCFGGFIYYRKEFEFLKTVNHLGFKIAKEIERRLFLVDSGSPQETTGEMVSLVSHLCDRFPRKTKIIFNQIEIATREMTISLLRKNLPSFRRAISDNQSLLSKLGVVSAEAEKLLNQMGHLGKGKITGAGGKKRGSGFILFLADDPDRFLAFCQEKKLKLIKFNQSSTGLKEI